MKWHFAIVVVAACGSRAAPPATVIESETASTATCLADRLDQPTAVEASRPCDARMTECRAACERGRAVACVEVAYVLERDPETILEAAAMYQRACIAGLPIACTNYGSYLLHGQPGLDADPVCAYRLHRWACDVGGEPWGCGMVGLELGEGNGVAADVPAAKQVLVTACSNLGGFSCWIIASAMEIGDYGTAVDVEGALVMYQRASRTGFTNACADADRLSPPPP
jgi:TPR repeat protein